MTLMAVMVVEMDKKNVFFILLLFGIFMTKMIKTNMMKIAKMAEIRATLSGATNTSCIYIVMRMTEMIMMERIITG